MGKKLHKRMNGEQIKIHQHDNYQMPGAYKQDGDKNKNQPIFRMGKPYSMGTSMRGPLDKHSQLKSDEKYDAKMAFNPNLTSKARMHYLENNIADRKGPGAYGKMEPSMGPKMRGPLNQAKPDYIDIDGDGDKKESMKQAAAQKGPEMRGPLNQKQVSFKAVSEEELKKLQEGAKEAAQEKAGKGNKKQQLKTNIENKKRMKKQ